MRPSSSRLYVLMSILGIITTLASAAVSAALDVKALTDDHSINVPAGWWTYKDVSSTEVTVLLTENNARLTDLEVSTVVNGSPRYTVRMVRNSGAYAVPAWWWYEGQTAANVANKLSTNKARLIEIEPYDAGGGVIRFAIVMVSNSGAAARNWSWRFGITSAQITSHLTSTGHRLIDLDTYSVGGAKRYAVVLVANTGVDNKSWEWWLNQSRSSMASKIAAFKGRVVKLDRQPNGTYNFIQVANTGNNASAWWYSFGFTSLSALNRYAEQLASRPIDVTSYADSNGVRRYDAAFIDNANTSTRRMRKVFAEKFLDANGNPTLGIFEAFLKRIDTGSVSTKVSLNAGRRAEVASSLKSLHLLHAMRQVQSGADTLDSAFLYYEYDAFLGKDACPDTQLETVEARRRTNYNFEKGLDEMMSISDNRTTRGTVLRYGGFAPFNATAAAAGLIDTNLRHNIGCAYKNSAGKYDPSNLRNETSAADLARIFEGVWNSTLLNNTHSARAEYLESTQSTAGAGDGLQAIIAQEAASLGKSGVATAFGAAVQRWGKGGSYGTCLPDANGDCGQKVMVRSGAGLTRLPIKVNGVINYRTYAFARLISDTPVPCFEDKTTTAIDCPVEGAFASAYGKAANELYRDEVRSALQTW